MFYDRRCFWPLLAVAAAFTACAPPRMVPLGLADKSGTELAEAFAEIEQQRMPVVVGVARRDQPTALREFGALVADGIAPADTLIDLNSITKTVTGVMILKLVEQGRLGLEDKLAALLANVPADKAAITVHQLLTHSAGFKESVGNDAEQLTKGDFLERAFKSRLRSPPGERYHYSNVGYSVLAAIVEEKSGLDYEKFLQDEVLAGTDLRAFGYMTVYDDRRSLRDKDGRSIVDASWGGHAPYWNLIGNGGLLATAEEFMNFRRHLTAGRILKPELFRLSQTPHVPETADERSFYGYGLVVQDLPEVGRFYWHDGGNDNFSAMWADFTGRGDLIFVAGADAPEGDAFKAMQVLVKHLYGIKQL